MKKLNYNQKPLTTTDEGSKEKRRYAWKVILWIIKIAGWLWKILDFL